MGRAIRRHAAIHPDGGEGAGRAAPRRWLAIRAQVGWISRGRLQRRRRGSDPQPQPETADPLLSGTGPGAAADQAEAGGARRRDRDLHRRRHRLRRHDPAHPPRRVAGQHARRRTAVDVHRLRPAGRRRREPDRDAAQSAAPATREVARPQAGIDLLEPGDPRPRAGHRLAQGISRHRPRRDRRQEGGRHLSPGRARHDQGQRAAHRRLCGGGFSLGQRRQAGRLALAGRLPRQDAGVCWPHLGLRCGAATGAGRHAGAPPRRFELRGWAGTGRAQSLVAGP